MPQESESTKSACSASDVEEGVGRLVEVPVLDQRGV